MILIKKYKIIKYNKIIMKKPRNMNKKTCKIVKLNKQKQTMK